MSGAVLAIIMLASFILFIALGFPIAFTLMALGIMFGRSRISHLHLVCYGDRYCGRCCNPDGFDCIAFDVKGRI